MTTENAAAAESRAKPRITLSTDDYERLARLANAAMNRMPDLVADLAEEIGRAEVVAKGRHPKHVVSMNREVEFRDDTTGKTRKVVLVYPGEADISHGKISVLTPIGTALIGVHRGHSITWKTPSGEVRQLTVLAVRDHDPA